MKQLRPDLMHGYAADRVHRAGEVRDGNGMEHSVDLDQLNQRAVTEFRAEGAEWSSPASRIPLPGAQPLRSCACAGFKPTRLRSRTLRPGVGISLIASCRVTCRSAGELGRELPVVAERRAPRHRRRRPPWFRSGAQPPAAVPLMKRLTLEGHLQLSTMHNA